MTREQELFYLHQEQDEHEASRRVTSTESLDVRSLLIRAVSAQLMAKDASIHSQTAADAADVFDDVVAVIEDRIKRLEKKLISIGAFLSKENDQLRTLCQFQQEQIDLLNAICPVPEMADRFDATDILEP